MSPSQNSRRGGSFGLRFLVRLVGWSFSAAIALIVLTYLALPALIRYGLPQALARYGVVSSVEGARISLINEQVTLVGFHVGQAGGPAIHWGEVSARVDMAELLKGNIRILDFQVKDARLDLAQLRASEWKPPDSVAAIPELRKLNIDIGNVILRDLELIGLSEQVGKRVALRRLSLGSLSHLEAGERVAFQLEGAVGDGLLRLAGQARMVENLPVFEGRYEFMALDLSGFGQVFGLATPRSLGGKVDGSGTFGLEYAQGEGLVQVNLSGDARVDGLELDSGEASVTRTVAEWSGDAQVWFPLTGDPPHFIARGQIASPVLEAARRTTAAPYAIIVRDLEWRGEILQQDEFRASGALSGGLLRIDSSRDGASRLEIELARLSANSGYRSGLGWYEFETEKLTAESAKLTLAKDQERAAVVAFDLLLQTVRLGTSGSRIGSLEANSAEAKLTSGSATKASRSARFVSISAGGIEIRAGASARVEQLQAERAGFDFHGLSLDLTRAQARDVTAGSGEPFEAGSVLASSLRQRTGIYETWASNLRFSGAKVSNSGEVISDEAVAEGLSQTISGDPVWEANGVQIASLAIGARQIEAGRLSATRFSYGSVNADVFEIVRGESDDFFIRYETGIDAASVRLASMHYRSGPFTLLEFKAAELKQAGITFAGELSAQRIDADSARYLDANADVSSFEQLALGQISGRISTGFRIDAVHAARLTHDRAAGADYDAKGLELSGLDLSTRGKSSAIAGRLESLDVALSEGIRLTLEDVAAARPSRNGADAFTAEGGRVRSLRYGASGERLLAVLDIEVGAVDGDADNGHRIEFVRAAGAVASDPAAGGDLEIRAVDIDAIRISAQGNVSADRLSADGVSLEGFGGDPAPSFSSARMNINGLILAAGQRLRMAEVLVVDGALTTGLDEEGSFVLPELPFFSGNQESSGGVVIDRLETRQSARLDIFDRSTSPPFEAVISPLQARLENFHSNEPGRRATFLLDGRMDEFSTFKASGAFSEERDGMNLEVNGKIAAFELNRLNMYAAKHAKRAIRSGRGDADFDIAVRGRKLSGTIRFVFSKVRFERTKASGGSDNENQAELSLQKSFAMLKDKDGIVRLTVPVSGSLDDPRFNFSDGLVQALTKAVRNTVMLTFKPLGLLVGAAGLVGVSQGMEFKPVAFEAGEATLSGEGLAHLDALARELKKHPGVEVRICGRAVSADRIRMDQRNGAERTSSSAETGDSRDPERVLQGLAEQRALAVRRYLEEKKQIAPDRLIPCDTAVESTPGRLPRVDLPVGIDEEPAVGPAEESRG